MSVFEEPGRGWIYEFQYRGQRYRLRRGVRLKQTAIDAERKHRDELEREALGLKPAPAPASTAARFSEWAGVYWRWVQQQHRLGNIKRPERIDEQLRVVLRFWGAPPKKAEKKTYRKGQRTGEDTHAVYHDLRLDDPIKDPSWLRKWDAWLDARKVAGHTRNHYTSTVSRLYWFALLAENRQEAGVEFNPFADRPRARGRKRTTTLSPDQVQAILQHASYHVRLAVAISVLATSLRLRNILTLRFAEHVDLEAGVITVWAHKTDKATGGAPLVVPITAQLRTILEDAKARSRKGYVVEHRGEPVGRLEGGLKAACKAVGIPYGLRDGVTFHSLRHSVITSLARKKVAPQHVQKASGHKRLDSALYYMHLAGDDARETLEQVSATFDLAAATTRPGRRERRSPRKSTHQDGTSAANVLNPNERAGEGNSA